MAPNRVDSTGNLTHIPEILTMIPGDIPAGNLRLPKNWPEHVQSAFLHALSMAYTVMTYARGWAANSMNARLRLASEADRLKNEVYLLREELVILHARLDRVPAHKRPRYQPVERLRILHLKAARQWSQATVARKLLVDKHTICQWMKRLRERGEDGFLAMEEPVNRFPDFVRGLVKQLKVLCPTMGKVKIAQVLARAGLHISASSAGRFIKEKVAPQPMPPVPEPGVDPDYKEIKADYPNHVWHTDLALVPTGQGMWVPWLPAALTQRWPFCYWIVPIVDHFSRKIMGLGVFNKQPTSKEVCALLDQTIEAHGHKPKYTITDQGKQFRRRYKRWCRWSEIKPRFGALYRHGSIAVAERCIQTIKKYMRSMTVPLAIDDFVKEVKQFVFWYNEHKPHDFLGGCTPNEVFYSRPRQNEQPRHEPRLRYPIQSPCASPQADVRGSPGKVLDVRVSFLDQRKRLPVVEVVEVKEAA